MRSFINLSNIHLSYIPFLSVCLSKIYLYVRLPIYRLILYVCLYGNVYLSVSVYLCLSICVYLSVSVYLCLSICVCLSVSVYLCLSIFICLSVSVYLCLSICLYLSVCIYLCMSICVCLSICIHLSLSVNHLVYLWWSECLFLCLSIKKYLDENKYSLVWHPRLQFQNCFSPPNSKWWLFYQCQDFQISGHLGWWADLRSVGRRFLGISILCF